MSTQQIYNYLKVNNCLILGGQPTEDQLRSAAVEGFEVVINLATLNSHPSLANEGELVRSLGMAYHPIPVEWEHPTLGDFEDFEQLFGRISAQKVLVHCMANFRATAFYALYAMKHLGWSEAQAEAFRLPVWQGSDYPVWERFIRDVRKEILK